MHVGFSVDGEDSGVSGVDGEDSGVFSVDGEDRLNEFCRHGELLCWYLNHAIMLMVQLGGLVLGHLHNRLSAWACLHTFS